MGTRLIIKVMRNHSIICEQIVGAYTGEEIIIPRIDFNEPNTFEYAIQITSTLVSASIRVVQWQLIVHKVCFCSLPILFHGLRFLYVQVKHSQTLAFSCNIRYSVMANCMSRANAFDNIKVYLDDDIENETISTKNIVYHEIFE